LDQEIVLDALQEPPELLVSGCGVPPADIRVGEVPSEDQGLQTRGHY